MKKFAIFENKYGGHYAVEYCNSMETAPSYVKPSQLPCLVNRYGGIWSNFDGKTGYNGDRFIEFREGDDEDSVVTFIEKRPDNELTKAEICGYISPNGKYFHCECEGHDSLAKDIVHYILKNESYEATANPQRYLEKLGYIKIMKLFNNERITIGYLPEKRITKKQCDTLVESGVYEKSLTAKRLVNSFIDE